MMKLNRLVEITVLLLNRKTVTAAELAERFGVSTRTIYRDLDVLSTSGVPVRAMQGTGGGISLMEDYTLSRTTFTQQESEKIIVALKTLQATQYPEIDAVLEKLGALFQHPAADWVSIDFTPWESKPNESNKFDLIKNAILRGYVLEMDYINSLNERSCRRIAPLRLLFKSRAWYLWGYCYMRRSFRVFRVSRMKGVELTAERFDRAALPALAAQPEPERSTPRMMTHLVLRFVPEALHRLYDDYDDTMLHHNSDGTISVTLDFPEDDWMYGYLLSFGPYVEVLAPEHVRRAMLEKSKAISLLYE